MASPWHDTVNTLVDERPGFAVAIARDLLDEKDVPNLAAHLGPTVFNTRPSRELIADKVVLVGQERAPSHVLIVEAQQGQVEGKLEKMSMYSAAAWLQYDCPADVIVICPDRKTAAWYTQPVVTGMGGSIFQARVVFPEAVPAITDPALMTANPEMAVLSLAYHGDSKEVADAFIVGVRDLGEERAAQYYEYGFSMSSEGVRDLLRSIMATTHWPVYSDMAKEHYAVDYGKAKELFANPELASDKAYARLLQAYLKDEGVSPMPITRLATGHPDTADEVFARVLKRPGFTWAADGETLLRKYKAWFYQDEEERHPGLTVVGDRLRELAGI